jgi:hypothetical protein
VAAEILQRDVACSRVPATSTRSIEIWASLLEMLDSSCCRAFKFFRSRDDAKVRHDTCSTRDALKKLPPKNVCRDIPSRYLPMEFVTRDHFFHDGHVTALAALFVFELALEPLLIRHLLR